MRFTNAFANSGVCGPSRMSYYTGRYPISHGATWNRVPLPLGEVTLGEMIRAHAAARGDEGPDLWLAGKTHVLPDDEGLARLRALGAEGCVVLGEPAYYGRWGFVVHEGLVCPGVPPEYFMALAFGGAAPLCLHAGMDTPADTDTRITPTVDLAGRVALHTVEAF
mgnify:CR=1 FL=1